MLRGVLVALTACVLAPSASGQLGSDILYNDTASITTYLGGSDVTVQRISPTHHNRGVFIDGTLIAKPTFPWRLEGNPWAQDYYNEKAWWGDNVRLATGTYQVTAVDLELPAPGFTWPIARSYNARQYDPDLLPSDPYVTSDGYQGNNWFQMSQPQLVFLDADQTPSTREAEDRLFLVYGADRYVEFLRIDDDEDEFRAINGAAGVIQHVVNASAPDLYTYYDPFGIETVFFGIGDADIADLKEGMLWKISDPAGNVAYVGDESSASTALGGYDGNGRILTAYDTAGRRYTYTYGSGLLAQVKAEYDFGSGWEEVGLVQYAHYTATSGGNSDKDLKRVTVTLPTADGTLDDIRVTYYRYAESKSLIKYVLEPEGTRNFDWNDEVFPVAPTFNQSYESASDAAIESYSAAGFTLYDSDRRIKTAFFNGECGCSSGGVNGEHEFTYEGSAYFGNNKTTSYDSFWATRTITKLPDTKPDTGQTDDRAYFVNYYDETGQPMGRVIMNGTDSGVPGSIAINTNTWVAWVERNSAGQIEILTGHTSAEAYNHTATTQDPVTIDDDGGLVLYFDRVAETTPTTLNGLQRSHGKKEGTTGSGALSASFEYTARTRTIGAATLVRPLMTKSRSYATETSTVASGTAMDRATAFFSDTASNRAYLAAKTETVTWPAVPTGENGSNSTDDEVWYFRKDGTVAFHEATDGVFTHWSQDGFGLTDLAIDDADLGSADFDASDDALFSDWGLSTTALGTLHEDVAYAYDDQGRLTLTTRNPGGTYEREMPTHHHVLKDRRLVTLRVPLQDSTPKYYGPVSYTVHNHAGRTEVEATIALASAGTTTAPSAWINDGVADPVGAIDTGTLAHLMVNVYDEAGTRLEESRAFHTLGSTLSGMTIANYDPTSYGYDNRGRVTETTNPKGTIQSYEHDIRGNYITKVLIDSLVDEPAQQQFRAIRPETRGPTGPPSVFSNPNIMGGRNPVNGGGPSYGVNEGSGDPTEGDDGTGDGDGGPSQSQCIFISEDTDEIQFTRDYRGRVAIRDNPIAPHLLVAYDNRDRIIEIGYYSDLTGLEPGDIPSSNLSKLLALVKFYHDGRGTTWKVERHDIDYSGSPSVIDATLSQLFWADERGRTVKEAADERTKTVYDALGRPTHRFILAKDNDNSYADSTDATLSGDHVLEEHQTAYQPHTGNVLFTAAIRRHPGDTTTTGRLDDNADSDPLKITASDLEGRAQITVYWYDDLDRLVDEVDYGTYALNESGGPSSFDGATVASGTTPTRSDTALRTSYAYNDDGELLNVVDPRAIKTTYEYDPMGRVVLRIANHKGDPTTSPTRDNDIYTRMTYFKSHALAGSPPWVDELWVDVNGDGTQDTTGPVAERDQITKYTYGVSGDFKSGDLLKSITYPDGGVETYGYQVNGILTSVTKPIGSSADVVTTFGIDALGRRKSATLTIPTGIDGAVDFVEWTYDTLGRLSTVTQKGSSGSTVVDQVVLQYDGWGNLSKMRQDHDSVVGAGGGVPTHDVSFAYQAATGMASAYAGARTLRRTSMTLPNSNNVSYIYSSASGSLDDDASRVTAIRRGNSANYVEYGYLGLDHVVGIEYPAADVFRRHYGSTAGTYPTLDRFDRVVQDRWTKDLTTDIHFYDQDWTYDRNHNPTVANEHVHATLFDMEWTLDGLNRVVQAERGQWGGSSISTLAEDENWTLTTVGGWALHTLDGDGDGLLTGSSDLDVTGTLNEANELTSRFDDVPNVTYTLNYNDRGDLIDDGKDYQYVYDAFGRLRKVTDRATPTPALIAEYRYNGLGYLIGVHYDENADNTVDGSDRWLRLVYDDRWRVVAEHWDDDAKPYAIYVHHAGGVSGSGSYIDELAFRERDADADNGQVLEERRYYAQNWRKDVVAMLTSAGALVEQVRYSSYGMPYGLPAGDTDSDGDFDGTDVSAITGAYDVRKDANLDGSVNTFDVIHAGDMSGGGYVTAGRDVLGSAANSNCFGYGAYLRDPTVPQWHVRHRVLRSDLGRWLTRDPAGYVDGVNLYEYALSAPLAHLDPSGLDLGNDPYRNQKPKKQKQQSPQKRNPSWLDYVDNPVHNAVADVILRCCPDDYLANMSNGEVYGWGIGVPVVVGGGIGAGIAIGGGACASGTTGTCAGGSLVPVTRWGGEGLYRGAWVMRGKPTWWRYIRTGKWERWNPYNQYAPYSQCRTYMVPRETIKRARPFWNTLFGQWRYWGPPMS